MVVAGGGEVLINTARNVFDSYSNRASWGGQAADLHAVIGASRRLPRGSEAGTI